MAALVYNLRNLQGWIWHFDLMLSMCTQHKKRAALKKKIKLLKAIRQYLEQGMIVFPVEVEE